jgi:hypothetical protein
VTTEPEPVPTARDLRRRISYGGNCRGGHIPNLSRREVLDLLRLDDTALLTMHAHLTGPEARGKSCAQLAADLRGVCSYGNIKALLRLLHLLVPVRRNGNGHAIRDRAGRFVAEIDMGDVAPRARR